MLHSILKFIGFNTNPIQVIESMSVGFAWGWAGLCLLVLLIVPLFVVSYRFEGKPVKRSEKYALMSLRIAFVFLLISLIVGLNISVTGWIPQKNKIAILLDSSKSMTIKSEKGTRFEQLKKLIVKDKFVEKLKAKTGIEPSIFSFSNVVSPVAEAELENFSLKPTGNQTDISGAIKDISGNLGSENLLGIIAITDGSQTTKENLRNSVLNTRTPLYLVAPEGGQTKDISLNLTHTPSLGYLNSSIRVRGEIRLHNVATTTIPVTIKVNDKITQTINVKMKGSTDKKQFSFSISCEKEGLYRYSVSVPTMKNELTTDNNKTEFLLKVVKESLNVLFIAEKPSWDLKFLRIALGTDPNANLNAWTKVFENRWVRLENFKIKKTYYKPDLSNDIKNADIIVLRGVHEAVLSGYTSQILDKLQNGRMGILVLPSNETYQALGYLGTKLQEILPVEINNEKWHGIQGNMILTSTNPPYNFLHLLDDPIENSDFFRTLPKFDGVYEYGARKAGAEVILSSTVQGKKDKIPFLIKQRVGQGNVVMFCGGPIWPMGFRLAPSEYGFKAYTAFVVNLLKWLANRKENAQVSIDIPSARGVTGQQTTVRVWVLNEKHQLQSGAQVTLKAIHSDKKGFNLPCIETSEKGCYETAFIPAQKGLYKFKAKASYQGKTLGESSSELLVEVPTAEFDDPEIKIASMKNLASETGGAFLVISSANKLFDEIKPTTSKKSETKFFEARNSYIFLLLLLFLPLSEWVYRRVRGLS